METARLADVQYRTAILTNVTHEHLEFHGTIENYVNDKSNLFRKAQDFCIVNGNEKYAAEFINAAVSDVYYYYWKNYYYSDISTRFLGARPQAAQSGLSG